MQSLEKSLSANPKEVERVHRGAVEISSIQRTFHGSGIDIFWND